MTEMAIRIDPDIWSDPNFATCSVEARITYFDSLAYIAVDPDSRDHYPNQELVARNGENAEQTVGDLCRIGAWVPSFGGYWVRPYCGCRVAPVTRAYIPDRLRQAVYNRDGRRCLRCGTTNDLSLDHIHPWSLGGRDTFENLQTLCRRCNSRKGARVDA